MSAVAASSPSSLPPTRRSASPSRLDSVLRGGAVARADGSNSGIGNSAAVPAALANALTFGMGGGGGAAVSGATAAVSRFSPTSPSDAGGGYLEPSPLPYRSKGFSAASPSVLSVASFSSVAAAAASAAAVSSRRPNAAAALTSPSPAPTPAATAAAAIGNRQPTNNTTAHVAAAGGGASGGAPSPSIAAVASGGGGVNAKVGAATRGSGAHESRSESGERRTAPRGGGRHESFVRAHTTATSLGRGDFAADDDSDANNNNVSDDDDVEGSAARRHQMLAASAIGVGGDSPDVPRMPSSQQRPTARYQSNDNVADARPLLVDFEDTFDGKGSGGGPQQQLHAVSGAPLGKKALKRAQRMQNKEAAKDRHRAAQQQQPHPIVGGAAPIASAVRSFFNNVIATKERAAIEKRFADEIASEASNGRFFFATEEEAHAFDNNTTNDGDVVAAELPQKKQRSSAARPLGNRVARWILDRPLVAWAVTTRRGMMGLLLLQTIALLVGHALWAAATTAPNASTAEDTHGLL